jgi:predicted ATP-dependent Lon-type protease
VNYAKGVLYNLVLSGPTLLIALCSHLLEAFISEYPLLLQVVIIGNNTGNNKIKLLTEYESVTQKVLLPVVSILQNAKF